jgi:hypothetical protein
MMNLTASDNSVCLRVSAAAALARISYDFGPSTVTMVCLTSLENTDRYFSKGYGRPPGVESVPNPQTNKVVVFEDFLLSDFTCHHIQSLWKFCTSFMCNCIN